MLYFVYETEALIMKNLIDKVTFRHGATIDTRTAQSPMLTNSGLNEK